MPGGQPYSTVAQVTDGPLGTLVSQAKWNTTDASGLGVSARISEADNEIDTRLAGLGVALPFAANPPVLLSLSILYARYACLRDLYLNSPAKGAPKAVDDALARFETKFKTISDGLAELLDATSTVIAKTKFLPLASQYPETDQPTKDNYPNAPLGPYPDPPAVDGGI